MKENVKNIWHGVSRRCLKFPLSEGIKKVRDIADEKDLLHRDRIKHISSCVELHVLAENIKMAGIFWE